VNGTRQKLSAIAPWLTLLAVSILINYIDRGNLSIAAPVLKGELHLNAWQLGILLSSFFWTYTALLFVVGWLVDRLEVNVVIAAGYLVWSLATVATGLVHGFALLLVTRLVLGVGESVAFPSCSKILALHVAEEHRGLANGAIITGIRSGPAVGMFGGGLLMAKYGWRPVFIGIGLVSLAWLPAWRKWMPRGHVVAGSTFKGLATLSAMLRKRSFWGASAGHFCANYLLYVMVTWLPFYLMRERHLAMDAMARVAGLYFLVDAAFAMTAGALSDFFIRRGYSTSVVRKSVMAIGHTTGAIGMAACAVAGPQAYLPWLLVAGAGCGTAASGIYAFCQILAGPRAAGIWTGFQGGFANFAGVIAPALTGFIVNRSGNFRVPFLITAAVALAGGFAWVFGVGRVELTTWAPEVSVLPAPVADLV
jgi:MFS transporter, ACS family, D-galactonate transporter